MVIRSSRPPGDPDGTGTAVLPTNAREFEICYDIDTENLELPLDAGIDYEKQGEFGQVVIELFQNSMDPGPGRMPHPCRAGRGRTLFETCSTTPRTTSCRSRIPTTETGP
jgi:hypothetical protein